MTHQRLRGKLKRKIKRVIFSKTQWERSPKRMQVFTSQRTKKLVKMESRRKIPDKLIPKTMSVPQPNPVEQLHTALAQILKQTVRQLNHLVSLSI